MQTLAQFEDNWRKAFLTENPEVRPCHYDEDYPRGSRKSEYLKYLNETLTSEPQELSLPVVASIKEHFTPDVLLYLHKCFNCVPVRDGILSFP